MNDAEIHENPTPDQSLGLGSMQGLGPTPPLVERLRDWADDRYELQTGELPDVRLDLAAAADEIERLRAEAASFHMAYRLKCDKETKAQAVKIGRLRAALTLIHGQQAADYAHDIAEARAIAGAALGPNVRANRPTRAAQE